MLKQLLNKELKLAASLISFLFISFGLLTFCPGYPILVGAFFVCQGIFQSFQSAREANDIIYTALLPVAKKDVVKSKFIFCIFIELCSFLVSAVVTLIRMTVLADAVVYRNNALMNANLVYLAFLLLIYACFNAVFVGGFFKTAYKFGKPFVISIIVTFIIVGIAETLHHIPGLGALNAFGFDHIGLQLACLAAGAVLYAGITLLAQAKAVRDFEGIDL